MPNGVFKMNIGQMRYKELLKKIPEDLELVIESKGGNILVGIKKALAPRKGVKSIPTMF